MNDLIDPSAMASAIAPRGPDASGSYADEHVAFYHARLAILDLDPRSNQPFHTERYVLCYNGEIFNFRSVRDELKALNVSFATSGDTEVLARAIETWGVKGALPRLAGMFAFAVYDRQTGDCWLVRDRLGIKPLYYVQHNGSVCFASWPAALLRGVRKDWRLDRAALRDFFLLGACWDDRHFVEGIRDIPAGCMMHVAEGNVSIERYWEPSLDATEFDPTAFHELFEQVAIEHTVSDVPMALLLSGGVDSSALAAAMRGTNTHYFHLRSEEEQYARTVADAVGKPLAVFSIEGTEDAEQWLSLLVERTGNTFAAAPQPMAAGEAVARAEHKVLLSANGADELFFGYPRTPTGLGDISERLPFYERVGASSFEEQVSHLFRYAESVRVPEVEDLNSTSLQEELLARLEEGFLAGGHRAEASLRLVELRTYVQADLNVTLDHATMCYGVEARVPFLDHRLVEYALTLPASNLVDYEVGRKAPLKRYLDQAGLPSEIWERPKRGFALSREAFVRAKRKRMRALRMLMDEGYLDYSPRGGNVLRDYAYVLNAAQAFAAWKAYWIDGGHVRA